MTVAGSATSHTYKLPLKALDGPAPVRGPGPEAALSRPMLIRNAQWFCQLRWRVVGVLFAFGLITATPAVQTWLKAPSPPLWPWWTALVIGAGNCLFAAHARLLSEDSRVGLAKANLWVQIVFDLAVLTVVVHCVGSLQTSAATAYLLHIVLACIFFAASDALLVTALAGVFYVGCVALEEMAGLQPAAALFPELRPSMSAAPAAVLTAVGSHLVSWLVVWFLTSRLSAMVRERDNQLAATNRQLVLTHKAKTQHMLRTTHELKSPFAAIHAYLNCLLQGYCGELPETACDVLTRSLNRCNQLAAMVQEMLQLANLEQPEETGPERTELDLVPLLNETVEYIRPLAEERGIELHASLAPGGTVGVADHFRMLFRNLLGNAVIYSLPGGMVRIACNGSQINGAEVTITDHGIGIPPDKLSRIFDPYFRAPAAVSHYARSTGLGLAIVREVAQAHRIQITVTSSPGEGTQFVLRFPQAAERQSDAEQES